MRPMRMTAIIGGKRYNTDKSVLIADSVSPERGRPDQVDFLFRSDAGDYFVQHRVYAEDCYSGARGLGTAACRNGRGDALLGAPGETAGVRSGIPIIAP